MDFAKYFEKNKMSSIPGIQYEYDFFFCYSRQDAAIVRRVQYFLQNAGYSCWIDKDCIAGGMKMENTIYDAIENSKCVIFFHSESSCKSNWAYHALGAASKLDKRIFPIMVDETPLSGDMLYFLARYARFDMTKCDSMPQLAELAEKFLKD